jgi:osmotically-inducible protein OsmY
MRLVVTEQDPELRARGHGLLERVWRALEKDSRLRFLQHHGFTLALQGSDLILEGEVPDVAAKRRAVYLARQFDEVRTVVDGLQVEPSVPMRDAAMRALLRNALLEEPAFIYCRIVICSDDTEDVAHDPPDAQGDLRGSVISGIVVLEGHLPSLARRRLARLLCWWLPGTRDVRGDISVPSEDDNDDEINDAVQVALEKEPLIDGDQLMNSTLDGCVTLTGTLPSEVQQRIAERDAWYIDGVIEVDNRITVYVR